ncbi:MAG: sugar phosphate isomerase/epimerase [Desulfonatronovibrio sp. MSAO_Bac4]|nr:MAG: sugar phosphate isomerase/epimerase [Desulfonatronovibrio sp. MSAO_Bac4]
MTSFFVNLPLKFTVSHPEYQSFFLQNKICPELGLDCLSMDDLPSKWHTEKAKAFLDKKLKVSVHMPFLDLNPGSLDKYVREASEKRLVQAVNLAQKYYPSHIIIHSGYHPGPYDDDYSRWLNNSASTLKNVLKLSKGIPVYLENVYEQDPTFIKDLINELDGKAGFCFDLGHWFSFGQGEKNKDLGYWLQTLAPYLKHLHLHDNFGDIDEHLGMGAGKIPFVELFAGLEFLSISPTFTLEPHSPEDLEQSLEFIRKHQYWFSLLGLRKKDFDFLKGIRSF